MNTKMIFDRSCRSIKRNSPTILSVMAAVGVVGTVVMAVRETPKAQQLLEKAKKEKEEELTVFEKVVSGGPVYIPAILMGAGTIMCIFGANSLNKKNQASLVSAYTILNRSYKDFKTKVDDLYGGEASKNVEAEIVKDDLKDKDINVEDDKILCYEFISEKYFTSTRLEIASAMYHINRNFQLRGYTDMNEVHEFLDIGDIDHIFGCQLGWSVDSFNEQGLTPWIDYSIDTVTTDDGLECHCINFIFGPEADFMDWV